MDGYCKVGVRCIGPTLLIRRAQLTKPFRDRRAQVKSYVLLFMTLTACAQQRPVVLAPVRLESPGADTPVAAQRSRVVLDTQRDDPFATTPGDFFRSIENSTGEDLSWFWRSFFYTSDVLDIGIDSVVTRTSEGQKFATISLHRFTSVPFPVRLRVGYSDGTTQDFSLPVNIWARGNRFDAVVPVRANVVGARLWPDPWVPDWNSSNDTWGTSPPPNPAGPVTRH